MRPTAGEWHVEPGTTVIWGECSEQGIYGLPILRSHNGYGKWARSIPHAEHEANLNFVSVAYNQCVKINPDNPQAVAEGIGDMWAALKEIEEQFGYCLPDPYISRVRKALGKGEGGEE